MNIRTKLLIFMTTLAALCITCSLSFASQAAVDSDYGDYCHPSQFDDCIIIDGVDVSYWQADIDWNQVKRQGIDYALIRIGYTGLDSPFSMNKDSYFIQNYNQAREAGVMVGIYYYSCATTMSEAKKEAQYVLDLLDGRELDLPIVYDFEYAGRLKSNYVSRSKSTSNILAFLNYITTNSDYEAMFYSYRSIMDKDWNAKCNMEMIDSMYKVWIAQYSLDISYARPFQFWQYTSSGSVKGIDGRVDCNFWYYDNEDEVTAEGTLSIKDANVTLNQNTYTYTRYKKTPIPTVVYDGVTLTEGTDYKISYIKNVLAGTGYVVIKGIGQYSNVQLVPFTIKKTDLTEGGTVTDIETQAYTGEAIKPTFKVYYKGTLLKKGVDYSVSYTDNTTVGTATVTIKGKRNFYGTMTTTFEIASVQKTPTYTGTTTYTKNVLSDDFTLDLETTSNGKKTYTSSDETIATVSSDGTVTLQGKRGTVYITMTTAATGKYYGSSKKVTITVNRASGKITTEKDTYAINTDSSPFTLSPSVRGTGTITYSSNNSKVITVDETGLVTPVGLGKATITIYVEADDQYKATSKEVNITVTRPPETIAAIINDTKVSLSTKVSYGCIKLTWKKSQKKESVDYYEIYRSTTKGKFGSKPFYKTKSGSITTYKNTTNLVKGKRYYYKVRGVRVINGKKYYTKWSTLGSRYYKYTSTATIKIINGVKATKVTASSSRGKGYIKIKWKKSSSYKVSYYQVYRSTKKDSGFKKFYTTSSGKASSYKNTKNLVKGKRYYYKVRGVRVIDGKKYYTKWSRTVSRVAK